MRKSRNCMRGLIVNSGNANCCTKQDGYPASVATASRLAAELSIDPSQVLVCSTGVIGAPLRVEKILAAVPHLTLTRSAEAGAFEEFARSIMTTDTRPKWAAARCRIGGKPNLATMLAFITTDAAISAAMLSRSLRDAVKSTFNSITVDGDTSTNDTVAILANGASGAPRISTRLGADYQHFLAALESVCESLALSIVDDGEGAQRVIEIEVQGAPSDRAADQIARTIANSPLVKTAFAGADPNWGRILAAAGRSGVRFNPERTDIWIAGVAVCRRGREHSFDERTVHRKMLAKHVPVRIHLRSGVGVARILTCDLTVEYVHINSSYRT
jgi:glutamate N-acetyltransferase/amino-acid N-acetyltransferase